MATIVGGIATSHTPTIGFALDTHKRNHPLWAPIFHAYEPVQRWLKEKKPDVLEKLGATVGTTNLHIYAAMRGQSLEDFQKTRNAQVLYSVAGQEFGKKEWDQQQSVR
jgi:Aromatic-ring-opening dioxygenase LigAB, LigA subunit/Catalytic LigB subunit of aromatic ring-opening dioxygenase